MKDLHGMKVHKSTSSNKLNKAEAPTKEHSGSFITISRSSSPHDAASSAGVSDNTTMFEYLRTAPFFLCVICHTYLLLDQIEITHTRKVRVEVRYPIIATAIGLIIDNIRLALGNVLADGATSKWLTYAAYFLHLVGLPSLFLTISSFFESLYFYDAQILKVIGPLGIFLTTAFTLDGIHSFFYKVMGHLVITDDAGIMRYTLDPSKKSMLLILPAMIISGCGIALGAAIVTKFHQSGILVAQLVAFIGQALTPVLKTKGMYSSNLMEVVFLASIINAQRYI